MLKHEKISMYLPYLGHQNHKSIGEIQVAALTHICMWSDKGWKRITAEQAAEQAAKRHLEGTVSAHSGLFMCELCGQYVGLTAGW